MADACLSFLVNKLGEIILDKFAVYRDFNTNFNWIQKEISMMKASFKDADIGSSTSETVKEWLAQLNHVAFKIEDVIDDIYIKQHRSDTELSKARVYFALEFPSIKEEIESIVRRGRDYGLLHVLDHKRGTKRRRECHHQVHGIHEAFVEEPEIVGFDEEMKKLTQLILGGGGGKMMNEHNVISVVGMRGSGKSTLARKAYNQVKFRFECHAWITVCESFQIKDALKHMYEAFRKSRGDQELPKKELESLDERELKSMIYTYLCEKRYTVVLDDICDLSIWDALQSALPRHSESKIIFTSPFMMHSLLNKNENCHFLFMNPLPLEYAWKLFCKKAFPYGNTPGVCPEHLINLGHVIVNKCGGLPLAIILMGGILSKMEAYQIHWERVLINFNLNMLANDRSFGHLEQTLQANFDELPSHLKYCLLYCCTFPKSFAIKRNKLLRLWIAEGFIQKECGKALEDTVNEYYIQLIEMSFLLPILSRFDGEPHACKVHDIVHEFGKLKFQEEFGIFGEGQCHEVEKKRRLVIHGAENKVVTDKAHFGTRSLLIFNGNEFPLSPIKHIPAKLKYLRVLSLEGILMESLPNEICDLILLRYLGLRGTQIKDLPRRLKKLRDLQTLDVRGTRITHWPIGVDQLENLKHMLQSQPQIYGDNNIPKFPFELPNLLTLSGVSIDKRNTSIDLSRSFPILQRLDIVVWDFVDVCISRLQKLSSLKLYYQEIDSNGDRQWENLSPPHCLQKLVLRGVMKQLPQWFDQLKCLRVVCLVDSSLVTDPLSNLSKLPSLVSLSLYRAYTGEQMGCEQGGFPMLRHLHIDGLVEFTEWSRIEVGTMSRLKFLSIVNCTKLSMLPDGFQHLTSLQSLEFIEMPDAFQESLETNDYLKIKHISKLTFIPRTGGLPHDSHEPAVRSNISSEQEAETSSSSVAVSRSFCDNSH